jgi:cell division transport system ATP-binding protein
MIRLENVTKTFGTGASALIDVTLGIEKGEFVFIVGPSGSGKTTFLRLLIRDMIPSKGKILLGDLDLGSLPASKIPHLRKRIGVVFQDLKLLMDRTIFENIVLPLEMANVEGVIARKKVEEILSQVGILEHKDKYPVQLSGGELQRAAIARALIFSPEILLADEPTGNLDATTSWEIVKLLQDINALGTTVIMATHNTDIVSSLLKRVITLNKGELIKDEKAKVHHSDGKPGSSKTTDDKKGEEKA